MRSLGYARTLIARFYAWWCGWEAQPYLPLLTYDEELELLRTAYEETHSLPG